MPQIYSEFSKVLRENDIEQVAIESLIHVKNVSSLAKLAQARGAIIASLPVGADNIFEYSPNKIKASVSGFGHADKRMIHSSIEQILSTKINCATHDE